MKSAFIDKLVERIGRIGPDEMQNYVLRLASEKGFLETIFNALQEGVIVTDAAGVISYMNEAAAQFFGLNRDDCPGKPLATTIRGVEWAELVAVDRMVSRDMEIFYPQNRFLNFYVVPLDHEKPKRSRRKGARNDISSGYAMILRDITETRRSTAETIETERLSALTLLAAGVAHEIGNPLNSLHIHLQVLERKMRKLEENQRAGCIEAIDVAKEEIKRLDHIVTQFLRAIRPSPLETRPDNLNEVVRETVAFLGPEIADRDIIVETSLQDGLPLVSIDRNQLKQAFFNIIKNSVQAMQRGGILHVRTWSGEDHVQVEFADSGGGMPLETMNKIFDPYFTTKQTGSGLGLLIVQRIVREHGGEISLANDEGRGLTFTIRLPLHERRVRLLK